MTSAIEWVVLGSSSGKPSESRACSGYLLTFDERLFLFDCGSGVTSSFLRSGYDPLIVEAVLISHAHSDHISDLSLFLQLLYLQSRRKDLQIFLPAESIEPFRNYLGMVYLFPEKLPFPLQLLPVSEDFTIGDGMIRILAHPNSHLAPDTNQKIISDFGYPNKMESFSFVIYTPEGKKILYSSDISSLDEINLLLEDVEFIVVETTHIELETLARTLVERNIGRALLTHISDDALPVIRDFARDFRGSTEIFVACDGLHIVL